MLFFTATAMESFPAPSESEQRALEWRTRNGGVLAVAHVDGKPVAGVSGPWSGKYALTWWERPLPQRQLELFDTLDDAKCEVERWAMRMRTGYPSAQPCNDAHAAPAPVQTMGGLLDQVRGLIPRLGRDNAAASHERVERMRQLHDAPIGDLDDLHFAAYE